MSQRLDTYCIQNKIEKEEKDVTEWNENLFLKMPPFLGDDYFCFFYNNSKSTRNFDINNLINTGCLKKLQFIFFTQWKIRFFFFS